MKVAVAVRTLNEARNIGRFCAAYDWADRVLVADGGSTDETVEIAGHFSNVQVRSFDMRVPGEHPAKRDYRDRFHNPACQHFDFLVDWAEGADWIIFDDCDCVPCPALKRAGRQLLEQAIKPSIFVHRFHMWGSRQYFPKMNQAGPSLWAWQPGSCAIRGDPVTLHLTLSGVPEEPDRLNLQAPPHCLLHDCYPDEETVARKMENFAAFDIPFQHPLTSIYAPPEPLPGWVYR